MDAAVFSTFMLALESGYKGLILALYIPKLALQECKNFSYRAITSLTKGKPLNACTAIFIPTMDLNKLTRNLVSSRSSKSNLFI